MVKFGADICCLRISKLTTDDVSVVYTPIVVTHDAPRASVFYLYTPLVSGTATNQAHWNICKQVTKYAEVKYSKHQQWVKCDHSRLRQCTCTMYVQSDCTLLTAALTYNNTSSQLPNVKKARTFLFQLTAAISRHILRILTSHTTALRHTTPVALVIVLPTEQ